MVFHSYLYNLLLIGHMRLISVAIASGLTVKQHMNIIFLK